jgi:hypothetical protein
MMKQLQLNNFFVILQESEESSYEDVGEEATNTSLAAPAPFKLTPTASAQERRTSARLKTPTQVNFLNLELW